MEAGGTRRILCAFVAILILFAVLIPQTFWQADAATDGRYVSIVLDDSGSMSDEPNRWQNALYALEVFAGMLGNNDTLVLQTLNRSNDVLTVDGSDLQSCMQAVDAWVARQRAGGNTLFESVPASAYREVRKVTASEKWVIHLTDGEYNDISDYKARFLSETSACDCKTVFLGLSLSKVAQNKYAAPNDSELIESLKKQDFYVYYADNANETIGKVREIAQLVFENYELCHDSLRMSGSTLTFDLAMPVEEMIILVQGNGLSMGTLVYQGTEVSGECCQICVGTTSGCIGKFRGQLRSGVYSIDFGKSPVDYRVYVRPYLDIGIQFRNDQGELLRSNPKVLSKGTYTYEIGLIDPYDKSIIEENAQTAGIYADISSTIVQNGVEEIGKRQGTLELQEGSVHVDAKAYLPPSNKEINTGNGIDIVIVSDNAIQPIIHIYDDAGSEVEDRADLDTGTYSYDVELTTAMTGEARETLLHSAVVDVDIEQDGVTTKGASAGTIQVGTETMAITATATVEGAVAGSAVRRLSAVGDLALTFTDYEDTWPAEGIETQAIPNITRYLGGGTELSFFALKNQISKTYWYGGEAYPVTDAHWISKQYYCDAQEEKQGDFIATSDDDKETPPIQYADPISDDDCKALGIRMMQEDVSASDESPTIVEAEDDGAQRVNIGATESRSRRPYHERYYLLFGDSDKHAWIDVTGTSEYLNALGFKDNALFVARKNVHASESNFDQDPGNGHECDFCGVALMGTEYEVLKDGRERCMQCGKTAIREGAAFEDIFRSVVTQMEASFGIKLSIPVKVRMVNAKTLHRKIGKSFIPSKKSDGRVLGVAIKSNDGYTLLVENGAPRAMSIMTMVHELTHIWQYENWNAKSIRERYAQIETQVYEGMAVWVSIRYMYLVGDKNLARREELRYAARNDEYGYGYILYLREYPMKQEPFMSAPTPFSDPDKPLKM